MKGISPAVEIKVIINKLRGKVSLVEQDIIDYASTAYFEQNGFGYYACTYLCSEIIYFSHENMKKYSQHDLCIVNWLRLAKV